MKKKWSDVQAGDRVVLTVGHMTAFGAAVLVSDGVEIGRCRPPLTAQVEIPGAGAEEVVEAARELRKHIGHVSLLGEEDATSSYNDAVDAFDAALEAYDETKKEKA